MKQFLIIMMSDMNITNYYITGKSLQDAVVNKLKENVNYFGHITKCGNKSTKDFITRYSEILINDWMTYTYFSASEVQYYILDITDMTNILEIKETI